MITAIFQMSQYLKILQYGISAKTCNNEKMGLRCWGSLIRLFVILSASSGPITILLHSWRRVVARSEASSIPTSGTFFRGDLVMKTFLRPLSLFRWFKKGSYQLLAKECAPSTGKLPRTGGGLPRNSVARLTDRARNDLKCVEGP